MIFSENRFPLRIKSGAGFFRIMNRQRPDDARLQKALVVTLSNMLRYNEAIAQAHRYIVRYGEDLTIIDTLKVAHFYTGKIADAVKYGQRGLELRDAEACGLSTAGKLTESPWPPSGGNVISFSLWGAAPFYGYGAMINLVLSRTIYPGWTCRFYVDAAVPRACVDFLANNGGDVRRIEDEYPSVGLFQRFLVMNDHSVGGAGAAMDQFRLSVPCRARPCAAQRIDDRLPVGRAHRLRHRHCRIDAALFRLGPQREIRARPAHARAHAVAADPQPLPGARQILSAARRTHGGADGSKKPIRRRPPEYRRRARRGRTAWHSARVVG
jgi:hypothetical protein